MLLVMTLFCTASPPAQAREPTMVTLATHDLCPYGCYDEYGAFDGYAVQVLRYAFEQMDIPLSIVVVPWERAQQMARTGRADGFFAASRNMRRDSEGTMSAVIADQKWNWYLLRDNTWDPRQEDFKHNAKVAGFLGANMLTWLEDNGYNVEATPPTTKHLVDMLLAKRFDAMLANNLVMREIIAKRGLRDKLRIVTLREKPLGVYFSNRFMERYPLFIDEFNGHVREYRNQHP